MEIAPLRRPDGVPIFFAGLWSGETFCLLTTATDGDLAKIHDRRPLSLRDEDAASWLAEVPSTPEKVAFCAVPAVEIAFHPVAARVGSPRHDGPDLITPVEIAPEEGLLPGF
jgi:putative SOS response-associated peptidase YedK